MKTKVLVVPTLIIASAFVIVQYIKPDFDTYLQKRIEIAAAQEHALLAESIAQNVNTLKSEIGNNGEKVAFITRYLPTQKDEARIFDSINFLTNQAGLITSNIGVQSSQEEVPKEATFSVPVDPLALGTPAIDPVTGLAKISSANIPAYTAPKVRRYSVTVEALGGYSNMKDLIKRIHGFDRIQELDSFSIVSKASGSTDGVEEESTSGNLSLTYSATLPYQEVPKEITGEAIVGIPGLQKANFDFSVVDALRSARTNTIPDTILGTDGKANPFE